MTAPTNLVTLAADYASGARAPDAVLDAIRGRIEGAPRPVWITVVPRDRVRARLGEADPRAPLFGVPFAVKDNIDVAGLPTTAACPDFAYVPDRSAPAVEALERAGAILVGKTNMDQFATGLTGTRSPYGACRSVYSDAHASGGSSSGSAVAVALGLAAFALGTDTAGSGRVPAAFNGIVGLKPTRGLVSTRGVVPACRTLDCVSVFAHTVADASAVLGIIAGYDAQDAYSRAAAPPPARKTFRFGVPRALPAALDAANAALYAAAVERLTALGGRAEEFDLAPFLRAGALLYAGPFVAERLASLRAGRFLRWEAMDPSVAAIIRAAETIDAAGAFAGQYALAEAARAAAAAWTFDAMLLPTAPRHPTLAEIAADPIGVNAALGVYTSFANLLDLCAIAVPAGMRPDGLPFGVTLLAPAFADAALASLAARLHGEPALAAEAGCGIPLAVVGVHLQGETLNHELTNLGGRLLRATRTAPGYRLFALDTDGVARPGLLRDFSGAGGIAVEVWALDPAAFGAFVAKVPSPLCIGTVALADGTAVHGFLCEHAAVAGACDITGWGGWRAWRDAAAHAQ